jgi:hypothetical protein
LFLEEYRVSQEEKSIFRGVIVSVILCKNCRYTCALFRMVSDIELMDVIARIKDC